MIVPVQQHENFRRSTGAWRVPQLFPRDSHRVFGCFDQWARTRSVTVWAATRGVRGPTLIHNKTLPEKPVLGLPGLKNCCNAGTDFVTISTGSSIIAA